MSVCDFCHDEPVVDAATWLDGRRRDPAPCPRCGKVIWPKPVEIEEREAA